MISNYKTGHLAEKFAAEYLSSIGFGIIDINWKNKLCEIDIIASKSKTIYFVEVKYRKNSLYGKGFDYISDKKLNQMKFAADMWVTINKYSGDFSISAIEIEGESYEIINFVEEIF